MEGTLSRRGLFRAGAGAALAGGAVSLLGSIEASADTGASFVPADPDVHLLRRATYGVTPKLKTQIKAMGADPWLDKQLAPASIDDSSCEELIANRFPGLSLGISKAVAELESGAWDLMFDLGVASIARACWSRKQLLEVMVDFWSNHLNVTNPFDGGWATRHDYDKKVIRKYALGRFEDMLVASATHPAMMLYLNNAESTKDLPNENYGRELLELHSVGVGAGYSETDMYNSTLVMTGFGINWETQQFDYHPSAHYVGPVQVMSWSSENPNDRNGYEVGISYVRYLAHHPSTAHRIAYKLCERFVSDAPPDGLVNTLAGTYLANDTDIAPVLRKLLRSTAFANSIGQKVRRPMEDIVATVRALGIKPDASGVDGLRGLYWMIEGLGNAPMNWPQPNGYPDVADSWRSAGGTLGRWNSHMSLAAHWWPSELILPSLDGLLPDPLPATYGGLIDSLAKRLVWRKLSVAHRDAICAFLGETADARLRAGDEAVSWRLPYLVALILDSPYHFTR